MTEMCQLAGKRDYATVGQKGKGREDTLKVCPSESRVEGFIVIASYRQAPSCT